LKSNHKKFLAIIENLWQPFPTRLVLLLGIHNTEISNRVLKNSFECHARPDQSGGIQKLEQIMDSRFPGCCRIFFRTQIFEVFADFI